MDSGQFPQNFSYQASSIRPEYPTPPPSFTSTRFPSQEAEYIHYDYLYSPDSSDGYLQSPTPTGDSLLSAPLSEDLALSTAGLVINDEPDIVSISTVFHPGVVPTPDTLISSSDSVIFYIHSPTIAEVCPTAFRPYLSAPISDSKYRTEHIHLNSPSDELNVILHTLYGTSPAVNSPSFETLVHAIDRMPSYSIPPASVLRPSSPTYDLLLSLAPLHPLDVYALSAHHELSSLAISVSSHLLAYDLSTISDDTAERIGAIYLKKLLLLHVGRFNSLKGILLHPPLPHPPTRQCNFEDQRKLTRAWALVSAYLAWEARPDLSTHSMQTALSPLMEHLTCEMCHQALKDRIKDVVVQWASVKVNHFLHQHCSYESSLTPMAFGTFQ